MSSPSDAAPRRPIFRTVARFSRFLGPYRARFIVAGIALLIAAGCALAMGQGLKLVIDRGFTAADPHALDQALFALLGVIAVMAVATYVRFYNVSWIGERVTADLRRRVFDHLLTLSPGFFEVTRTGEVISRLTNDTTMLETVIGSSLSLALRNVVLGLGALVLLMLTSLKLTLLVLAGRLSAGQLSAFVFYAVIVATSIGAVSEVAGDLQRAAGATERLMELLETKAEIAPPVDPVPLPDPPRGTIALEDVTFCYPSRPNDPALRALSLRVAAGERVALVGPSGAGKTTVFQLLLRFYDPQAGRVLIDGVDVRTADPRAVRGRIAVVPQDPVIFAASVWDNVRYGRPDATDAEVRDACEAAYATEFLARLPQGMDSELGERGVRLSGGQRQRLAIARAVLARRPILLLDEATSALDAESERIVQLALDRLMQGRTTLIIAHRLSTVIGADRIIVLDGGVAMAEGTHATLVRDDPLYRRLASLQFGLSKEQGANEESVAVG